MDPIASFVLRTPYANLTFAKCGHLTVTGVYHLLKESTVFLPVPMKSRQIESKTAFPGRKTERISCFEILGKKTQYFDYFRWVCNLQIAPRRRVFCQTLEKLNGFWLFTRVDHQFLRLFPAIHLLFQIWGPVTVHFLRFLSPCHQVLIFMHAWSHTTQSLVYTNKRKHRNSNSPPKKLTQLPIDRPGYRGPPNHFSTWRVGSPNKTLDLRAKMEVQCLACSQVHRTAS